MGQAGIVLALDAFADRTGIRTFRAYARAGAAHLRAMTADGAARCRRGPRTTAETGFLSGSAGAAYMFFERYRHDHDPAISSRPQPTGLGERAGGRRPSGGLRWPLASDDASARRASSSVPRASPGSTSAARATGDPAT